VQDRFLNQIAGIERASRRRRQLAMRPSLQLRHTALKKRFGRLPVAATRPHHQFHGRLVADEWRLRRGVGRSCLRTHFMRDGCNDSGETRPFM
jgi:hypothetical protein